jgi:hypothetical protein
MSNGDSAAHTLYRITAEEALIDFLGGLLPGILFLVAGFSVAMPVVHVAIWRLDSSFRNSLGESVSAALAASRDTPSAIWFAAFVLVILLAYIVGHLFYRHDPRKPDQRSFRHLARDPQFRQQCPSGKPA